jgi:Mg-chelatase subunit ChlD
VSQSRLVRSTPLAGLRPVGSHGEPAFEAHRQLVAVLSSRLGDGHGALFARPQRRSDGGIDWFTERAGPILSVSELDAAGRAALESDLDGKLADIAQLARSLAQAPGDSARRLAALLQDAVQTPGPHACVAVGGRPLLILWGFAPAEAVPGLAPVSGAPSRPRASAAAAPVLSAAAAAPWLARDWWRWLLLLLLLLIIGLLALRACAPLPPQIAEEPAAPADALLQAEARGRELERELAALRREREQSAAACALPAEREVGEGEPAAPPMRANAPVTPAPQESEIEPPATSPSRPDVPTLPELPALAEVPRPAPQPQPRAEAPESGCTPQRLPSQAPEVAIVVDASGSMEEPIAGAASRLDAAKGAIGDLLNALPADVDVGLVEFRDCERVQRDRFYSGAERGQLKAQVDALQPGRGTPLARSVERAGAILSTQVPAVMIVVTDGEDSCGGDPCAAAREIKRKRPNLVINVIDIGSGGASPAACMAEITGGRVYKPGSAVEFDRMVTQAGGQQDVRECS